MTDDDGTTRPPEAAFALFGHELRVEILFALWAAERHSLPFAELQSRVGERDSGKFNYHLSKLVGQFVGKNGDEYELRYPGHRVIDAIRTGFLHRTADVGPVTLDTDCRTCGAALTFTYEEYVARVGCLDCGDIVVAFPFDPGGVEGRSDEGVVDAFDRRTRLCWRFAVAGVCPMCAGVVRTGLAPEPGPELDSHYTDDHPAVLAVDCRQCSFYNYPPAGILLCYHPAVAGWFADRGIDLRTTPLWALDFVADPDRVAVEREDPLGVTVTATAGGERLRVSLDESARVTALERTPADGESL
ncbi:DUF7351 domain-containing protein [Haloarcula litorea]|uniref:DUF7351 domain-containing protein n=1 Tax=Haloarcula litorea TaxID=3032579 RepID=UPI0023E8FC2D|nr:hypothetical protein [Halomicroarcula sp. GDY20]